MSENNQTKSKQSNGRGGARKNAGRKPGSATKRTREIANKAAEEGVTPLEFMLAVMRTEPSAALEPRDLLMAMTMRFEAAKAAAPYMHPRLTAIAVSGDPDNPLETVTRVEIVGPQ